MSETVEILRLGHAGDGLTEDGLFVPYTVPGDVVRVIREGPRGRVQDIVTPGPSRAEPFCSHFGRCGGCALPMVAQEPYLAMKRARGPDLLMALSELASALRLARLNWNGETVAMAATPSMTIGRFTIALPPESFLQPTREGEAMVQALVREEAGNARRIADLFSGCGTFALALAEGRTVHAVDSAEAQIDALAGAAKAGGAKLPAETR